MGKEASPERVVQEIRRKTRRRISAEEKIRIVLEGLRGEESIATLCRKEGLAPKLYYRWSKEFLEAGKKRLVGDTSREATAPEVTDLRKENTRLKQLVAGDRPRQPAAQKKRDGLRLGRRHVRLTAAEKGEVIRLVEGSDLSVRQTLRELAWQVTDREGHFFSESSVYRILKAFDLITSPAFVVLTAGQVFQHPTRRPNELWQTDFTYLHVVGWGWYYLSTVLDDYSRYIWPGPPHVDAGDGRDGDPGLGAGGDGPRCRARRPSAAAVERQRPLLHLGAARDLSGDPRAAAHAQCAVSSDDPRERSSATTAH